MRALGNHRLPQIIFRHLAPDAGKILFQTRGAFLVQSHGPPHDLRGHFLRDVASGRPKPAGSDDDIGAGQRVGKNFLHAFTVIAHRRLETDVDAHFIEFLSQIGGVRIDDLPQKQFAPRRHKLCNHILPSL